MGQKVNPIAIRLQTTNRFFNSCWYSDLFYTNLINQDIKIHVYLNCIIKQLRYPSGRFFFQNFPKKSKINIFLCNSKISRNLRSKIFQVSQYKKNKKISLNDKYLNNYFVQKKSFLVFLLNNLEKTNLTYLQKQFFFRFTLLVYYYMNRNFEFLKKDILLYKLKRFQFLNDIKKLVFVFNFFNISDGSNYKLRAAESIINNGIPQNKDVKIASEGSKNLILHQLNGESQTLSNLRYNQSLHILYKKLTQCMYAFDKNNTKKSVYNSAELALNNPDFYNVNFTEKESPFSILKFPLVNEIFIIKNFKLKEHLESIISKKIQSYVNILPFKILNDYQSAIFLAEEIVFYLERRIPFRKIKNRIIKEVETITIIKGIRIACSGRVGGRSKKAQRAKTDSIKYGETSLHVFSSKIDFASKSACTTFGLIGVKVWICYN